MYLLNLHAESAHKMRREKHEETLVKLITNEKYLKEDLLEHKCVYRSSQTSYKAYKKLHTNLLERYQEQINYMANLLDFVGQSLKYPESSPSEEEKIEIVESCLKTAQFLSKGMITKTKEEFINLRNLLEEIKPLFAEKTYKFNITLKISCPENLSFYGDFLFTQLILINLLGKSIHRIPKNGKIIISVKKEGKNIKIEIQDKGYSLNKLREKLIKKTFHLFIGDTLFQQMCRENGLIYEASKTIQGFNITKIIIPDVQPEDLKSNVIKLFK